MKASILAIAGALTLSAGICARADDPGTQPDHQTTAAVTALRNSTAVDTPA